MSFTKVHQYDRSFSLILYAAVTFLVYPFLFWGLRWALQFFPEAWFWSGQALKYDVFGLRFAWIDGVLYIIGLFGFLLGQIEHREVSWQNGEVMDLQAHSPVSLKKDGWYSRVRHPMYQFFIVVLSSLLVSSRSLWGLTIALIMLGIHWLSIIIEEKELKSIFGIEYLQYIIDVPKQYFTRFWMMYMAILYGVVVLGM